MNSKLSEKGMGKEEVGKYYEMSNKGKDKEKFEMDWRKVG